MDQASISLDDVNATLTNPLILIVPILLSIIYQLILLKYTRDIHKKDPNTDKGLRIFIEVIEWIGLIINIFLIIFILSQSKIIF